MKNAIYQYAGLTDECLLLRDCGPWEHHPTITNAAEQVVKEVAPTLGNRRLEYIDSEGVRSQLLVKDESNYKAKVPTASQTPDEPEDDRVKAPRKPR